MHARMAALAAVSLACLVCWPGPGGTARAQPGVDIPQSERIEDEGIMDMLKEIAKRAPPVGPAAEKVLPLMTRRLATDAATVLPPLVLLPVLASEDATPDMRWAIALADRVKAEQDTMKQLHEELKAALIGLRDAASSVGDRHTVGFTNDLIADDLDDQEVLEPTAILIGEFLRGKLPAQ